MKPNLTRRAFTLIELLIVLGISALLSVLAITYSNVGRNAVALSVETAKISQLILQAKALSIATYRVQGGPPTCGYGAVFDMVQQTYSMFAYSPAGAPPCPSVVTIAGISSAEELQYTQGTWKIPVTRGVTMQAQGDSLIAVLFYPPNPTVLISHDGSTFLSPTATQRIHLLTADGQNNATISVNPEGQVNF